MDETHPKSVSAESEPEWKHSGWKHPYVIYIFLTVALFAFLVFMGWMAIENQWIPQR
jgi:hypothetical protein